MFPSPEEVKLLAEVDPRFVECLIEANNGERKHRHDRELELDKHRRAVDLKRLEQAAEAEKNRHAEVTGAEQHRHREALLRAVGAVFIVVFVLLLTAKGVVLPPLAYAVAVVAAGILGGLPVVRLLRRPKDGAESPPAAPSTPALQRGSTSSTPGADGAPPP
jgi:Flp pilus assembly protein TadB